MPSTVRRCQSGLRPKSLLPLATSSLRRTLGCTRAQQLTERRYEQLHGSYSCSHIACLGCLGLPTPLLVILQCLIGSRSRKGQQQTLYDVCCTAPRHLLSRLAGCVMVSTWIFSTCCNVRLAKLQKAHLNFRPPDPSSLALLESLKSTFPPRRARSAQACQLLSEANPFGLPQEPSTRPSQRHWRRERLGHFLFGSGIGWEPWLAGDPRRIECHLQLGISSG